MLLLHKIISKQHAQTFQHAILCLKHYASNMLRSFMDHLQGETTSNIYV